MNPLKPVVPFEPIMADQLPSGEEWIAQIKWDGVRMLVYYDGVNQTRLINRKGNERTQQYPELLDVHSYCNANSVILDGEVIALVEGSPSFHQVMKRDSLRSDMQIRARVQQIPIVYMIFDVLFYNGEWVTGKSLLERQAILQAIITPNNHVQLVPNYNDLSLLYEVARKHQLEGIVCKNINSTYALNGKDGRWIKRKNIQDVIAVVGGITYRDGTINALMLGLYDEQGLLWYIGHAGTGKLKVSDWQKLTELTRSMIQEHMPFVQIPQRSKGSIWIRPELTVKVHFLEWTASRTLRQPSIQAFVEIPPMECRFE
ncbi:non-homologous end-joining DNA ligase [Paenibacillus pini]|uniref:DNA ligase (ATP) n=2 Tax=Paenibacillus TaxID=44249 RepID=W7YB90_9BACL|nr:ATP-dependent DNA ligase [Paenibacillus pini JCM 16418]